MCGWWWRFPYFGGEPFYGMPWMMIFGSIFWLIIIFLIFYAGWSLLKGNRKEGKEDLLNTLKKRLANGEISEEEFERIKKILNL